MINSRTNSIVVNSRIGSSTIDSRTHKSTVDSRSKNDIVNSRVSSFQQGIKSSPTTVEHLIGTPLGLLLALTYSGDLTDSISATFFGDFRPNVRIK